MISIKHPNIALIGYRGVGKTTLGQRFATKYSKNFIDLDQELEKKIGPISLFWEKNGESAFRTEETQILKALLPSLKNAILSCGGGTPISLKNREMLKEWGIILWLTLSPEIIYQRLKLGKRPALTKKTLSLEISETLAKRNPHYQKAADLKVVLQGNSIQEDLLLLEKSYHIFCQQKIRE